MTLVWIVEIDGCFSYFYFFSLNSFASIIGAHEAVCICCKNETGSKSLKQIAHLSSQLYSNTSFCKVESSSLRELTVIACSFFIFSASLRLIFSSNILWLLSDFWINSSILFYKNSTYCIKSASCRELSLFFWATSSWTSLNFRLQPSYFSTRFWRSLSLRLSICCFSVFILSSWSYYLSSWWFKFEIYLSFSIKEAVCCSNFS